MKPPEEIKKGLLCDGNVLPHECEKCAYGGHEFGCVDQIERDALAYIQQLESRLAQVERERDALYYDLACLPNACDVCTHDQNNRDDCEELFGTTKCAFEWRGVCAENTEEGTET